MSINCTCCPTYFECQKKAHESTIDAYEQCLAALEGQQSPESAPRYTLRQFLIDVVQTGGAAERDVAKAALDLMTGRDDQEARDAARYRAWRAAALDENEWLSTDEKWWACDTPEQMDAYWDAVMAEESKHE